jgi:hypothetical protein
VACDVFDEGSPRDQKLKQKVPFGSRVQSVKKVQVWTYYHCSGRFSVCFVRRTLRELCATGRKVHVA